jgi:hypothetical protein
VTTAVSTATAPSSGSGRRRDDHGNQHQGPDHHHDGH